MAAPKTRPTDVDVDEFLATWPTPARRAEAVVARELLERVTGEHAVMWGPTMVGFGAEALTNSTGTHEWFVVGFSPRKGDFTFYGLHDADDAADPLLAQLGPHTLGKACLYIRSLAAVDLGVLEQLVLRAWTASQERADSV